LRVKPQPLNVRTLKYWSDRLPAPAYDRDLVMPGMVHVGRRTKTPGYSPRTDVEPYET
jgi:hypothetical protein